MIKIALARVQQRHRTMRYPRGAPPPLPDRFRGRLLLDRARCPADCRLCVEACPTGALSVQPEPSLDLGRCLFCGDCQRACPAQAITFSGDYRLAARGREALVVDPRRAEIELAAALERQMRRLFGRSLHLRQVSAGGCNACEADINVLNTVGWDLGRFGIKLVASPRHADGVLITGPVTQNMHLALKKSYDAVPAPKLAIAVGACALSGGLFAGHPETGDGAASVVPLDLLIPGCPPHPLTILDGLLRLLGRLD
jgi:Ni,Fe-hydrogenase III small subunit/NAD-dependent dihydropyrimidine dehydrogenase PreA subunit